MEDELWKPTEAAQYLSVSIDQMYRWRRKRAGPPFIRLGPYCIRYLVSDLKEYVNSLRVPTTQLQEKPRLVRDTASAREGESRHG